MYNNLLTIGPITVHGYGLMIAIGILAAYLTAEFRAKKMRMEHERVFSLTVWGLVGGIVGSKVLYYITIAGKIIENPKLLLDFANGFVIYGGIIGGVLAGFLYCRKYKLNFLQYFDLVIPSVALAQGFGRIGCTLAGCCYGIETTSPVSIVFKNSEFAPNGVHLVPTQPISSFLDFLNFFALIIIAKRTKANGQVAGFYLIFYSVGRFILEFFRGDLIRGGFWGLSTSQWVSFLTFAAGLAIVAIGARVARKKNVGDESSEEA